MCSSESSERSDTKTAQANEVWQFCKQRPEDSFDFKGFSLKVQPIQKQDLHCAVAMIVELNIHMQLCASEHIRASSLELGLWWSDTFCGAKIMPYGFS